MGRRADAAGCSLDVGATWKMPAAPTVAEGARHAPEVRGLHGSSLARRWAKEERERERERSQITSNLGRRRVAAGFDYNPVRR
jgi:hypothetical protein